LQGPHSDLSGNDGLPQIVHFIARPRRAMYIQANARARCPPSNRLLERMCP